MRASLILGDAGFAVVASLLLSSIVANQVCFYETSRWLPSMFLSIASNVLVAGVLGVFYWRSSIGAHSSFASKLKLPLVSDDEVDEQPTSRRLHLRIAGLSFLGVLNAGAMIIAAKGTEGALQSMLYQLTIPLNMLFSILLLRTAYRYLQYAGALLVLGGIIVVLAPQFFGTSSEAKNDASMVLLYAASIIPTSLASVLAESALRKNNASWGGITLWKLSFYTQLYQIPMTALTLPLYSISALGKDRVPMDEIGDVLRKGARCLFALSTSSCTWKVPVTTFFLIASNVAMTVLAMMMYKKHSAAAVAIVSALSLPATTMVFNAKAFGDTPDWKPDWSWTLFLGLVLVLAGNLLFKLNKNHK